MFHPLRRFGLVFNFANSAQRMEIFFDFVVHQGARICAFAIPHSPYASMYGALVCGIDVPVGRDKALFLDTGLIHILVVSGAHLVFVEQLCRWLPARVRLVVVGIYCWLTGFGAPVVRAFARRLCARWVEPLGWSGLQVEALTTVVLLMLFPFYLTSRSFLMSWLCALALQAPLPWPKQAQLNVSLKCYVFLLPFAASSPLSILWNCLAGPLIGAILFPACLVAFTIPWFVPISDAIWTALFWLLETGPRAPPSQIWFSVNWVWWIPFVIHFGLLFGEWKWRRALAFLSS